MRFSVLTVITIILITILAGCQIIDEPGEFIAPQVSADETTVPVDVRFADGGQQSTESAESILAWSEKYQQLLKKTEELTEKNNTLSTENNDLHLKVSELTAELDKTRAELKDANTFIQEMHAELGKWKSDVLGFREEIRSAQAAELVALQKILKLLGAEMTVPEKTSPEKTVPKETEDGVFIAP